MSTTYFGWFSQDQFNLMLKQKQDGGNKLRYNYWIDENDKIVQITELTKMPKYNSKFTDVKYLGKLKKSYKLLNTPLVNSKS